MAKPRIVFHYKAFNEFRNQPEIAAELLRRGEAIAERAGDGVIAEASPSKSGSRARVVVITATAKAMADEAAHRSLTRSLSAGQG